ncbi:hypothetical protein HYV22_02090 [Candidatus Gottesmanbacteria bacterium]|nr:hypothetical protein [Candidatus Gottesmanbacteria bacterium]
MLILLLAGIALGVYLVQQKTNLFSKAGSLKPSGPETSFSLVGPQDCTSILCLFNLQKGSLPEEFQVQLLVRSDIDEANLFKAKITFPADLVEIISISTDKSFIQNWVENFYDNSSGQISLTGGVPAPGFKTEQGQDSALMATIIFRTKNLGKGTLVLTDESMIYRNTDNLNILTVKRPLDLNIDKKPITAVPAVTLEDYWQGKAEWKLYNKMLFTNAGWVDFNTNPLGHGAGTHIEVVGDIWYLFTRKYYDPKYQDPSYECGFQRLGATVRKSLDQGKTWSDEVDVIVPTPGKPWECMAPPDGDTYYDAAQNKWHFLFQCLAKTGGWKGCHLERQGADPMGLFQETHPNPIISGKDLWNKICNESTDDCVKIAGGANNVWDEGTFDIIKYDGEYFYVSFHGYDGLRGYRGIAKTKDFINWVAGDETKGVPKDAIFDIYDQNSWREGFNTGGPTGGGAARIIAENNYYYMLVEGSDISLGCEDGQNWDWGIYRSNSLTNTKWEPFPLGNPIIYSSKLPENNGKSMACNPSYAGIFKDQSTGKYYLHFSRETKDSNFAGIYFYELVTSNNLLKNADFWMCTTDHWNRLPADGSSTNRAIYRHPNDSSDGNCYLATNCGKTSCDAVQSIYQDIDMTNISATNVKYGGKFATDEGEGKIELVLHELDEKGAVITSHRLNESINSSYKLIQKDAVLTGKANKLRLETYLRTPQTFRLDEMFVNATATPPSLPPSISPSPSLEPTEPPMTKKGDGNKDGKINLVDMSVLLTDFNKEKDFREPIDMDDNKKINSFDYSLHRKLLLDLGVIKD